MKFKRNTFHLAGTCVAAATLLTACPVTPQPEAIISGVVMDGYIQGATIFWDCNNNDKYDIGETNTISQKNGKYEIKTKPSGDCKLMAYVTRGSVDSDVPNKTVSLPYYMEAAGNQYQLITPITTVVSGYLKSNPNFTPSQADEKIRSDLGINWFSLIIDYKSDDRLSEQQKNEASVAATAIANRLAEQQKWNTFQPGELLPMLSINNLSKTWADAGYTGFRALYPLYTPTADSNYEIRLRGAYLDAATQESLQSIVNYINENNLITQEVMNNQVFHNVNWYKVPNDKLKEFIALFQKTQLALAPKPVVDLWERSKLERNAQIQRINSDQNKYFDPGGEYFGVSLKTFLNFFTKAPDATVLYIAENVKISADTAKNMILLQSRPLANLNISKWKVARITKKLDTLTSFQGWSTSMASCFHEVNKITNGGVFEYTPECVKAVTAVLDLSSDVIFTKDIQKSKKWKFVFAANAAADIPSNEDPTIYWCTLISDALDVLSAVFEIYNVKSAAIALDLANQAILAQISALELEKSTNLVQEAEWGAQAAIFKTDIQNVYRYFNIEIIHGLSEYLFVIDKKGSPPQDAPYLDLEFNDCANIGKDSSANNFVGVNNGDLSCGTSGAAKFNGISQYLRYSNLLLNDTKTVVARFKIDAPYNSAGQGRAMIASKSAGQTSPATDERSLLLGYTKYTDGSQNYFTSIAGVGSAAIGMALPNAVIAKEKSWITAVIRYSSDGSIEVFHDGKLSYEYTSYDQTQQRAPDSSNFPLDIGADFPNFAEYFNGEMDYLKVYNRALSDAEIASMTTPVPDPISQGPVAHYTFTDCADLGKDSSGNSLNGLPNSGVTCVDIGGRKAAHFDGSTGYITVADNPKLNFNSAFTLFTTVRFNDTGTRPYGWDWECLVCKPTYGGYGLMMNHPGNNNALAFYYSGGMPDAQATTTLNAGKWYNIAAVYDGTSAKIYLDGNLVSNTPSSKLPVSSVGPLTIGLSPAQQSYYYYFKGDMANMQVFNRALSSDEVKAMPQIANVELPTVTVSPVLRVVDLNESVDIQATLTGSGVQSISWDFNPKDGGSLNVGATSGTPTATFTGLKAGLYKVTATSVNDPSVKAVTAIRVLNSPSGTPKEKLFKAVSAGGLYSLGLTRSGQVVAWGSNAAGQLDVPAGLTNVTAIAAGYSHAVALLLDGTVRAWGLNDSGQASVPGGLSDVVAIDAGNNFSVALKRDGTVVTWGALTGVSAQNTVEIAAGPTYLLTLHVDGSVKKWGDASMSFLPDNLTGVKHVYAGLINSAALGLNGKLSVWGWNGVNYGGINIADAVTNIKTVTLNKYHNQNVNNLLGTYLGLVTNDGKIVGSDGSYADWQNVSAISASGGHTLILQDDGNVISRLRDYMTDEGQAAASYSTRNIRSIAVAPDSIIGLKSNGSAYDIYVPGDFHLKMPYTLDVKRVYAGALDTGYISSGGMAEIWGWYNGGYNAFHINNPQIQDITFSSPNTSANTYLTSHIELLYGDGRTGSPVGTFSDKTNTLQIASSGMHALVLLVDGRVSASGNNDFGQTSVPLTLKPAIAVATGANFSLALQEDGMVAAWGSNLQGQTSVPATLSNVAAIAAGAEHALALTRDGRVVAWGRNDAGQVNVPANLTGVVAIGAGNNFSVALLNDGTLVIWGGGRKL